ncbi:MAG TPA: hypothetical protein VJU54_09205, partial [Nitrospiraceae bacterium]|nr:hypothetical protein [Nitrospiraceae bacterium]
MSGHQEPISQRELQQEALRHLKEHGPLNWDALYIQFDARSKGRIGTALLDLEVGGFIESLHNLHQITA